MNKLWISLCLAVLCSGRGNAADARPPADDDGKSVVSLVRDGRDALAAGDKAKARTLADAAVARDSGYAEAWKLLATLRLQAGETNAAAQAFRTALLIAPQDPASNRELAWLIWDKDRDQALASLDLAIQAGSADRDPLIRRVLSLLAETGQEGRALEAYKRWKPSFTLGELGLSLFSAGRRTAAAPFLEAAWQASENRPSIGLAFAVLESRKAQPNRTSAGLAAFFEKAPETLTPGQLDLLWESLLGARNDVSLKPLWSRIAKAYPVEPLRRTELAKRFETAAVRILRRGDDETAREFYRQAIVLDSKRMSLEDWIMVEERVYGTGNLLIAKSRACAAENDWEGALRQATLAVTNNSADGEAWKQLGSVQARMQQFSSARQAFEKAVALRTNDAVALQELGWVAWADGDRTRACEAWDKAFAAGVKDPDRFAAQVLGRMVEDGAKDLALDRHARWVPRTGYLATGLNFYKSGRMKAAEPFLAKAWAEGDTQPSTGFALARVRAINGIYAGTPDCLAGYITSCIATAATAEVVAALDTLRLCSGVAGVSEALDAAARALSARPEQAGAVTDVYVAFAMDDLNRGKLPSALGFFKKALGRDPNLLVWPVAWNLASQIPDVPAGLALLGDIQAKATAPAVREGVGAKLAESRGDMAAARTGYQASLKAVGDQPYVHSYLFDVCIKLGDLAQARREAEWMEARYRDGSSRYRDALPLALMWTELGEDGKALEFWRFLHLAVPDTPYYGVELAMAQFRNGQGVEAVETLRELILKTPTRLAYESLVQILLALGRQAEAYDSVQQGLAVFPSPSLRRSLAEIGEELKGTGSATSTLAAAQASLVDDPGSTAMSLLKGRALTAAGQTREAADWHESLLQRNPDFVPGLMFRRDQEVRQEKPRRALPYAERLCEVRPWDDQAARHYAMNLAEADGFSRAIRLLEPMAGRDQDGALAVLLYDAPTPFDYAGMNTVSQMVSHVSALAKEGYRFVNALPAEDAKGKTVMMILLDPDAAVVEALDASLASQGARAVIMVTPANLRHAIPRKLSPERLGELRRSGRWHVGITLSDVAAVPVRADGVKGNPLTHRIIVEGALETGEAMTNRVGTLLADAASALDPQAARWFYYPRGDYGQISLDTDRQAMNALSNLVGGVFSAAFFQDENGFVSARSDKLRLPAKSVPAAWNSEALTAYLKKANPVVKSRLELAKLLYWHGQSEAASYWFRKAGEAGADPFEVTFNTAANAALAGDLPVALQQSREAVKLAPPDDTRPARLLDKAIAMRRPTASLSGTAWQDNEERSYWSGQGAAEGPVRDWLRWNAGVSRHHWERTGLGAEEASRADLGFLAYVAPEVWVQAGLQEWLMDSLPDITGWQARLHVPNPWFRGNVELTSEREMMETVEALRKKITAHREGIEAYSRVYDFWDCYLSGAVTERSDGNSTWWASGRIIRRLKETPYLGVGYAGSLADSTFAAPEYWSPEGLQKHQMYAAWQATGVKWNGQISGQAGTAKERDTEWRFVWGARAVASYKFTPRLSAGGDLTYQGGPVYDRTTVDGFISVRW